MPNLDFLGPLSIPDPPWSHLVRRDNIMRQMVFKRHKHSSRFGAMVVFMMVLLPSSSMLMVHQQQQQPSLPASRASRKIRQSLSSLLATAGSSSSSETDPPPSPTAAAAVISSSSSSSCGWMTRVMTGVSHPQRPAWARSWMPTGVVRLRPTLQLFIVLLAYIFHMTVLAQHSISFPIQLIPNEKGQFQNIGWDS